MDCIYNSGKCATCGNEMGSGKVRRNCLPHYAAIDSGRAGQPVALPVAPPTRGPGTELSKLLKRFGINPTPTCQCRAKAQQMDQWGPDECERPERIDEVVAVMRAEATARGLPFLDIAGRMLVRRAISNARRNA